MPTPLLTILIVGYLLTITLETTVLWWGLSPMHPPRRRLFAGVWLTACTYPIVILVIPAMFDLATERGWYLLVAEIFAPLAECILFHVMFTANRRDLIAIVLANLVSFGVGEILNASQFWEMVLG